MEYHILDKSETKVLYEITEEVIRGIYKSHLLFSMSTGWGYIAFQKLVKMLLRNNFIKKYYTHVSLITILQELLYGDKQITKLDVESFLIKLDHFLFDNVKDCIVLIPVIGLEIDNNLSIGNCEVFKMEESLKQKITELIQKNSHFVTGSPYGHYAYHPFMDISHLMKEKSLEYSPIKGKVYIKYYIRGYIDSTGYSIALEDSFDVFSTLCGIFKAIILSWGDAYRKSLICKYPLTEYPKYFYSYTIDEKIIYLAELSDVFIFSLELCILFDGVFKEYGKALERFDKLLKEEKGKITYKENKLRRALMWFFMGTTEQDVTIKYVKYATALETLLVKEKVGISQQITEKLVNLIGQDEGETTIRKKAKKLYGLRCSILHSGKELNIDNMSELLEFEYFLSKALLKYAEIGEDF